MLKYRCELHGYSRRMRAFHVHVNLYIIFFTIEKRPVSSSPRYVAVATYLGLLATNRACERSGAGRFAAPSLKPFLLHPAPCSAPCTLQPFFKGRSPLRSAPTNFLASPLHSVPMQMLAWRNYRCKISKFCRRENFNEQFHENVMKFKKIVLRINHKRYKLKSVNCLLNMSI